MIHNFSSKVVRFKAEYETGTIFKTWTDCDVELLVESNQLIIKGKT